MISGFDQTSSSRAHPVSRIAFTKKHVYSFQNNALCGITLCGWATLLWKYYDCFSFEYLHRVAFITVMAVVNSLLSLVEYVSYEGSIQETILPDDPIIIIGHPRSGTTLIHNLLSLDAKNFFYCNTFCVGFPSSFLWFEDFGKKYLNFLISGTRPMDNMPLHFDLPQEDELATNVLSGGHSYYMSLWIMRNEEKIRKLFDFNPDLGAVKDDEAVWTKSFVYFMKKVVLKEKLSMRRNGMNEMTRRLVIKSPIHTGRINILRKIFPKAKFVYIHRNPIEVFQSAVHMADTTYWFCYFSSPSDDQILNMIMWQFKYMFKQYNRAVLMPMQATGQRVLTDDVVEVAYKDFLADPMGSLKMIYKYIGVAFDDGVFAEELKALREYKVNTFNSLSDHIKAYVKEQWISYYVALNYE